jgi:SpoU rRNA methylase family enzyme
MRVWLSRAEKSAAASSVPESASIPADLQKTTGRLLVVQDIAVNVLRRDSPLKSTMHILF